VIATLLIAGLAGGAKTILEKVTTGVVLTIDGRVLLTVVVILTVPVTCMMLSREACWLCLDVYA